jgi:hypothetical protein
VEVAEFGRKVGSLSYLTGDGSNLPAINGAHESPRRLCESPRTKSLDVDGSVSVLWMVPTEFGDSRAGVRWVTA